MKKIRLNGRYGIVGYALVDETDYETLSEYKWHTTTAGYAVRTVDQNKKIYMHRVIMNTPSSLVCDHINHNRLDNRRANLRNCTKQIDQLNRTKKQRLYGTTYLPRDNKWQSQVVRGGVSKYLGRFDTQLAAHNAYLAEIGI